jgi:hypothetical protein
MYRFCKFLHLIGLTLFLGSIFAHIVAGALAGEPDGANFLFARAEIVAATRKLTMPGLGLALLSGFGMVLSARISPFRLRWLLAHIAAAGAITLSAVIFVIPAGARALFLARAGDFGADLRQAIMTETGFGALNVLLCLALIALGLYKPSLRRNVGD